ncbi:MAG TPA: ABC transporter permease [Burkholderiales bacterium]
MRPHDKLTADAPPTREHAWRGFAEQLRSWSWLISLAGLLVLLEAAIAYFQVPPYVLPAPSDIARSLWRGFTAGLSAPNGYYIHIWTTFVEAFSSFVVGSGLGIMIGALIQHFPRSKQFILPYAIGLQSVPKIALAPLLIVWFGFGISSKIALGILLTFFPLMINTLAGLSSVERERIELMQSLRASQWKTFRLVQLPSAMPFIFAGLEMAAAYSVLGAVVGEFVGGQTGLGVLILNRNASLDISGALAALVILAVLGVGLRHAVVALRRRLLFWSPSAEMLAKSEGG